ncbi:hypothetical protein RD792_010539 [Penstemon davidsonii]|uniref:Kinesin motor domain-containing protein n=1 Tax=Penstemon davidsonii TaxID=160366 RepID=A0ABR0D423_9LAMI|nr:hypothetical protein RD792_010539 [Penstemon davidsonii]
MKHFMLPKTQILRENHEVAVTNSPNPKSKPPPTTPNPSNRKFKLSKENAPPTPSDPNSMTSSPATTSKMKSPLPPRPPLKRKLSVDSAVPENCAASSLDSGVKIDIFELIGAPLIENCLAGFNSSVFAYGQTGSGKTYTIWGASNSLLEEDQQGLAPRVFRRLFERIDEEQVKQADSQLVYMCRCSFLEIYNEQITDLLDPSQKNLQIREDVKTGVYVENLREEGVSSMKDVSQLLIKGLSNRRTSATYANAESSRSHSVFTCVIESRSKSTSDGLSRLKMSRMNFVDLAGSERQKQTGAGGERLKEAGNINRSLSQLGNLINILAEISQTGKQRHIPYRDSKLTFLLQESLGGNAKLAMICAISPDQSCKNETLSTLRFAQRAKAIKNKAIVNEEMQDDVNVLREVIRELRDELHRMKANPNQTDQNGTYATGWSARRSLNLLRFSLNRPMALPRAEDDSDEEMEIVDAHAPMPEIPEERCVCSPEQGCEDTDVKMEDVAFQPDEKDKNKVITCGLSEVIPEVALVDGSSGLSVSEDYSPPVLQRFPNEDLSTVEQCLSVQLSADTKNTPEKSTNCIRDGAASSLSIVSTDVSPVLKSPAPSVSPRMNNSRKSLRTSSTMSASQSIPTESKVESAPASIPKPSNSICLNFPSNRKSSFASTKQLAASLHRGLEIIESQRINPALRRSSFRFSCMAADVKAVIPVFKVDVGVQTMFEDDESLKKDIEPLCKKCNSKILQQELIDNGEGQNMQLVPVTGSPLDDKCTKQVPKAVEKVLAGAIRREMALEEMCAKQNSEITHLKRLVQQYKHERECNAIISQTREDKITRLESLMDGILPTEDFMEGELLSLTHEHKILQAKYDNHPDVLRTKIELKRVQDELERYQNFFDLGERDVLLEEIQDLRTQLQFYLDSSAKTLKGQTPLLKLTYSCEPSASPSLSITPDSTENAEERFQQERIQWTETESKWISLVEELKLELKSNRSFIQRQKQELEMERNCSEELKEAMQMAMEGHARMLEQYAELEEKHIHLLARHRKIQDGIEDVKKAASKAGVRGAESKFINALAAEISALKVEREKERRYFRDEIKGLQAQLRDTAEAVQAAGELLVRLKEAEEAVAIAKEQAIRAEQETEDAYKEIDKMNKLLKAAPMPKEEFAAEDTHGTGRDQQWHEEFAPSYDVEEEPSSWFSGYDRCNI